MKNENHVNLTEAHKMLGISKTTLYKWLNEGFIKKFMFGSSPRIKITEINRILKK